MSRPSSSASLPSYNRHESGYFLVGRRSEYSQFGSRYIQVDDNGVYLPSLVVTVMVSSVATIGILLFTLVITLAALLGSCQVQPLALSVVSPFKSAFKTGYSCNSFILNAEVNNLQGWVLSEDCKGTVTEYINGGQYHIDFAGAIGAARDYLSSLSLKGDGSEVVVMDIDETVLSNLPYYVEHNFGAEIFNESNWNEWVEQEAGVPFVPSVGLFNVLKEAKVGVVFLTGRPESQRNATSANLISAGFEGWTELMLRSPSEVGLIALEYKSQRRAQLEKDGYQVLTSIGDQWSDLQGPAAGERTFKLPNPMYYIF